MCISMEYSLLSSRNRARRILIQNQDTTRESDDDDQDDAHQLCPRSGHFFRPVECFHWMPGVMSRPSAKTSMPSRRSTVSIRTTGASLERSIAATIALSFAASRFCSNCSRESQSSTSNKVWRGSKSEYRWASRQPGATLVGPSMAASVRNRTGRLSSGAMICSENTIKAHVFRYNRAGSFLPYVARSGPTAEHTPH